MIAVPAVIVLMSTLVARRYLKIIDLVGPLAITTTVATIFILNAIHFSDDH